jgi:hypothetical protein
LATQNLRSGLLLRRCDSASDVYDLAASVHVYDELRRLFALPGRRIGHEHPEAHRLSTLEAIARMQFSQVCPDGWKSAMSSVDDQASLS